MIFRIYQFGFGRWVAEVGFGVLYGVASIVGFGFIFTGGIFMESGAVAMGVSIWAVGVIYVLIFALIMSTLGSILNSALYVYAVEGHILQYFDDNLIKHAFGDKKYN